MTIPMNEAIKSNRRRKRIELLEDILEAVKEFVLSRRDDIEKEMENFGMLEPVLNYFLEEGEERR